MKLLRQLFFTVVFTASMLIGSSTVLADIPYELEFTVVFNYDNAPIDGLHDVVFRLYTSSTLVYKETVEDVDFDKGVAKVVVGGEDTDLINDFFDDTDMEVSFSVLKHLITFPVQSVPYAIRTRESNKARRIDNENLIYFDEVNERVGVNNLAPEVSLDINGGIKIGALHPSDNVSNGVMYWHGNSNSFYGYSNGEWKTMSYYPDESDQSKWELSEDELSITSTKSVGIGMSPNTFQLAVSGNIQISDGINTEGDLYVGGDLYISDYLMLDSGYGFMSDGQFKAAKLNLPSGNSWIDGDIYFTGILHGNGEDVTSLSHFADDTFSEEHFEDLILYDEHINDAILQSHHISPGSIGTVNVIPGHVNEDYLIEYSINSDHILDGSIKMHHMILNQITSEDIKFNVFNTEKFKDDHILTHHIVDNQIASNKVVTESIGAHKIQADSITSEIIKDYTISASKIPLGSIPTDNLDFTLPIDQGGTAQTEFDEHGVLFITPAGVVSSNSELLTVVDGRLGLGGTDSNSSFFIQDSDSASILIRSEDDYVTTLVFENDTTSVNVEVDDDGHLNIMSGATNLMTFDKDGYVGIGTSSPVESLTLAGPLLLGAPNATAGSFIPGTIYYSGRQFYLCLTSTCQSISFASAFHRSFQTDSVIAKSSVIFMDQSNISGERLFVNDVQRSKITGQATSLAIVEDSYIESVSSQFSNIHDSHVLAFGSTADSLRHGHVLSLKSNLFAIDDALVDVNGSRFGRIHESQLTGNFGQAFGIFDSFGVINHSDVSFVLASTGDFFGSQVSFIDQSILSLDNSQGYFFDQAKGSARNSMLDRLTNVSFDINRSILSNVSNSSLMGDQLLVLDADNSQVYGRDIVSLSGRQQTIHADHVVAIGDNIQADHDNTVLINASQHELISDRDGQLKIQADGDVRIQFTDEIGLSLVDGMGRQISDKNLKFNFLDIDAHAILNKVKELPVYYWQYQTQENIQHIGPTAQDFSRIFNYGNSEKVIHSIDSDGVLLASIQALNDQLVTIQDELSQVQNKSKLTQDRYQNVDKTLNSLVKRSTELDVSFQKYAHKLDQFEADYDTQLQMIQYIETVTRMVEYGYYLKQVNRPMIWFAVFLMGIVGILIAHIVWKRWRRR